MKYHHDFGSPYWHHLDDDICERLGVRKGISVRLANALANSGIQTFRQLEVVGCVQLMSCTQGCAIACALELAALQHWIWPHLFASPEEVAVEMIRHFGAAKRNAVKALMARRQRLGITSWMLSR